MRATYAEVYAQFIVTILIIMLLIGFILILFLIYRKRKTLADKEIEYLRLNQEKEILSAKIEIQEEIHQRISMDIHDNVGQSLLLANINLSLLQKTLLLTNDKNDLLEETKKLVIKASEDITLHSRSMNPDRITQIGLFVAIRIELENLESKNLFKIELSLPLDYSDIILKPNVQLMIFRVFQEVLKNIIKYAKASSIYLEVQKTSTSIKLTIKDNGVGFDLLSENFSSGIGLKNMKKRINLFRGEFLIISELNKGTIITITIPNEHLLVD